MSDGTTPINFKWAMDNVEILIIHHEDMVELMHVSYLCDSHKYIIIEDFSHSN